MKLAPGTKVKVANPLQFNLRTLDAVVVKDESETHALIRFPNGVEVSRYKSAMKVVES